MVGGHETATTLPRTALVRLTASGELDSTFGVGGQTISTIPSGANDLLLDGVGNLLVGTGYNATFGIVRSLSNGSLDPSSSFGAGVVIPASWREW